MWVRISKLPFGVMNKDVGEAIGGEMGEFIAMEKEEDGFAAGRYLRIKIRKDIHKPLMRGVMVQVEGKEGEKRPLWCPAVYVYLPDFCYTCGLIGHIDKSGDKTLQKGEVQPYSKALWYILERRKSEFGMGDRDWTSRSSGRQGGSGSRGSWGSGRSMLQASGSDAPSWRKKDASNNSLQLTKRGEEEEVTSPVKIKKMQRRVMGRRRGECWIWERKYKHKRRGFR